jgi:hypothetical protein
MPAIWQSSYTILVASDLPVTWASYRPKAVLATFEVIAGQPAFRCQPPHCVNDSFREGRPEQWSTATKTGRSSSFPAFKLSVCGCNWFAQVLESVQVSGEGFTKGDRLTVAYQR